jgi:2-phospho-L-lactate guanylyltransferase
VNAGKSRLAAVLTDAGRARLNRWLLDRTLAVASAWLGDAARCVVVSPCEVTLALARKAGATTLLEQSGAINLNAALAQAAAHAAIQGAQRVLILPCDLPRLDVAALRALDAVPVADCDGDVVIAPDRHHQGTNALLVNGHVREFAFGADSYARHMAQGSARGVRTVACVHPALAFDLDTADDFAEWCASDDAPHEFLAGLPRAMPRSAMAVTSRTK